MDNVLINKALGAYGLNKKETKLYLAALTLGLASVQELAQKSGLKRTTIYSFIDNLKNKGVIYEVRQRGKKYFTAAEPQQLAEMLYENSNLFRQAVEPLTRLHNIAAQRPQVIFYKGRAGFKQLWRDILSSGVKEYLIITSAKEFLTFVNASYLKTKTIPKKISLQIKSRQLITDSNYAREIIKHDTQENRVSRLVPAKFVFPTTEVIFGNRVAIFTSRLENIIMLLESEEISKTHRAYFECLWEACKNLSP